MSPTYIYFDCFAISMVGISLDVLLLSFDVIIKLLLLVLLLTLLFLKLFEYLLGWSKKKRSFFFLLKKSANLPYIKPVNRNTIQNYSFRQDSLDIPIHIWIKVEILWMFYMSIACVLFALAAKFGVRTVQAIAYNLPAPLNTIVT